MATKRGKRLTRTGKYMITPVKGKKRSFTGTLLKTFKFEGKRLAIFSVLKGV